MSGGILVVGSLNMDMSGRIRRKADRKFEDIRGRCILFKKESKRADRDSGDQC